MTTYDPKLIELLCERQHDAYEAAAVEAGWTTQQASRKPWAEVPEANKQTMRASVAVVLYALLELGWTPPTISTPPPLIEPSTIFEDADAMYAPKPRGDGSWGLWNKAAEAWEDDRHLTMDTAHREAVRSNDALAAAEDATWD